MILSYNDIVVKSEERTTEKPVDRGVSLDDEQEFRESASSDVRDGVIQDYEVGDDKITFYITDRDDIYEYTASVGLGESSELCEALNDIDGVNIEEPYTCIGVDVKIFETEDGVRCSIPCTRIEKLVGDTSMVTYNRKCGMVTSWRYSLSNLLIQFCMIACLLVSMFYSGFISPLTFVLVALTAIVSSLSGILVQLSNMRTFVLEEYGCDK